MTKATEDFTVQVDGVSGVCPAGERWAEQVVMIDGCFLKCFGRVLNHVADPEKITHIDALPLYNKYTDLFSMEDVPEAERKETAQQVADKILVGLQATIAPHRKAARAEAAGIGADG